MGDSNVNDGISTRKTVLQSFKREFLKSMENISKYKGRERDDRESKVFFKNKIGKNPKESDSIKIQLSEY